MRTVLFFLYLAGYLVMSLFKALKLRFKLKSGKVEADKYLFKTTRKWGQAMMKNIGVDVDIVGMENIPEGTCLFVANHESYADIPLMLGYLEKPIGFIAKKEMENAPIISFWMKKLHCIFMDRSNIRESVKSINEGIENLKSGYSMVIFPEGTRSKGKGINEFKKGSMKLGIKADVPIVPVAIDGSYKVYEGNGNKIKSANVRIKIFNQIDPKSLSKEEQNNLAETIENMIKSELNNK